MVKWKHERVGLCKGGGRIGRPNDGGEDSLYADETSEAAGVVAEENRDIGDEKGGQNAVCGGAVLHFSFL